VDAQPIGCGRDARALFSLSNQTNVHIVASTGFHRMAFYAPTHWIFNWDAHRLAELFEREITDGMFEPCDGTPPKSALPHCCAGQIKTALEPEGITGQRRTLFLAAARAAAHTSAPLMVHVERGSDPVGLVDFCEANGIPPQKMIFCHMDRVIDSLETHLALCRMGAYLEYDTIGRFKYHSDEREAERIEQIVSAGYINQLLLSLDTTRERLTSYGGTIGLCYLIETFLPLLKTRGFTEQSIQQMLQKNPANAYAF
jgi:phosphotriesterase-related protein